MPLDHLLVRALGWPATILHGDPLVLDRWRWLRRHLRPGPLRTLDAGCGTGAFTLYAARIGNEALGLSWDEANDRKARERARILGLPNATFRPMDLRTLDQQAAELGTFDQVICLETIEHILDDAKLLRDLASVLRPGGRLLLTTPYEHYHTMLGDRVTGLEDGGHVRRGYTHESLTALAAGAGFRVTAAEYVSGIVSQQLTNVLRAGDRISHGASWAATFPLRILQVLDGPATRLTGYPAASVAIVATRAG